MITRLFQILRRNYVQPTSVPVWKRDWMGMMIPNLMSCRDHRQFLLANEDSLPPNILAMALGQISISKLQLDDSWIDICSLVKRQLLTYDKNVIEQLYQISIYLSYLGENSPDIWELIEHKLLRDNLYKFLSASQCVKLLRNMSEHEIGSDELWSTLEDQISDRYKSLDFEETHEALQAFDIAGRGKEDTIRNLESVISKS